jgi:hypothetical protein
MANVTVRFRGICCFISAQKGSAFKKRVILPGGSDGHHAGMEEHLPIIECFADELLSHPDHMKPEQYTRPGDDATYARIQLREPVRLDFIGAKPGEFIESRSFDESVIHLDPLMSDPPKLKSRLLRDASDVDPAIVAAVMDLPAGTLTPGPPEAGRTSFPKATGFETRRVARWVELDLEVNGHFGLRLTPLGKDGGAEQRIMFAKGTRLISIANEPLRLIVGQFVPKKPHEMMLSKKTTASHAMPAMDGHTHTANAAQPQSTTHFRLYWDLMADAPADAPVPEPSQGSAVGCAPANKP